ncbi:MAG TPA: hypothetical protein VFB96_14585 [Pirellulaceae bacterium]|nr:hypothetical protein [Pirellulaceae bacterium]
MARLRYYQLSLRRLFLLMAAIAGVLWLGLTWLGRITPQHGELLVTPDERENLQSLRSAFQLTYSDHQPLT